MTVGAGRLPIAEPGRRGLAAIDGGRIAVVTIAVALLVAVPLGIVAGRVPLLGLLVPVVGLVGLLMVSRIDGTLVAVLVVLYSNAAVVGVRLHGVPLVVAALIPFLLALPLAYRVLVRREPFVITPALPVLVVFVLVSAVSAVLSRDSVRAFDSLVTLVFEGVVLYLLVTNAVRTPGALRLAFWALVAAGAFMGGLSLFQELTKTHANDYFGFAQMTTQFRVGDRTLAGDVLQARAAGPIGEMNFYAQILLMLVPLGLALAWTERRTVLRLAALGATALIASGIILTFSRGAAVGFVLAVGAAIVLRLLKPRQVALLIVGAAILVALSPAYVQRLGTLDISEGDPSLQSRAAENQSAALAFVDHPVVGVGPGLFPTYYRDYIDRIGGRFTGETREAHNLYLGLAAETGILGTLAFAGILLVTLRRLFAARSRDAGAMGVMATALIVSMLLFLATSAFLHLAYERYFWLMLALAGAAGVIAAQRGTAAPGPAVPEGAAARTGGGVTAERRSG